MWCPENMLREDGVQKSHPTGFFAHVLGNADRSNGETHPMTENR
jgi:hypothetical protein